MLKKLKGGKKVKRVRERVVSTQRMSEQARDSSQRRENKGRTEMSTAEREMIFFFKKMGA